MQAHEFGEQKRQFFCFRSRDSKIRAMTSQHISRAFLALQLIEILRPTIVIYQECHITIATQLSRGYIVAPKAGVKPALIYQPTFLRQISSYLATTWISMGLVLHPDQAQLFPAPGRLPSPELYCGLSPVPSSWCRTIALSDLTKTKVERYRPPPGTYSSFFEFFYKSPSLLLCNSAKAGALRKSIALQPWTHPRPIGIGTRRTSKPTKATLSSTKQNKTIATMWSLRLKSSEHAKSSPKSRL